MEWIVNPDGTGSNICPASACYTEATCPTKNDCPSALCFYKFGGEPCTSKSCIVYIT